MASVLDIGSLNVALGLDTSQFGRASRTAQGELDAFARVARRTAGVVQNEVGKALPVATRQFTAFQVAGRRTSTVFSRQFRPAMQQVGFQVADIATQLQLGTNAIQVFAIQGGQLLGFFGAFGALAGAALTIIGGLAAAFFRSSDATKEAADELDKYAANTSKAEGLVSEMEESVKAYAEAIKETGSAQSTATRQILALTEREYNARQTQLSLEIDRLKVEQEARQQRIKDAAAEGRNLRAQIASQQALRDRVKTQFTGIGETDKQFEDQIKAVDENIKSLEADLKATTDLIRGLLAASEDGAIGLEKAAAGVKSFDEALAEVEGQNALEEQQKQTKRVKEAIRDLAIEAAAMAGVFGKDVTPQAVKTADQMGLLTVEVRDGKVVAFEFADAWRDVVSAMETLEFEKAADKINQIVIPALQRARDEADAAAENINKVTLRALANAREEGRTEVNRAVEAALDRLNRPRRGGGQSEAEKAAREAERAAERVTDAIRSMAIESAALAGVFGRDVTPQIAQTAERLGLLTVELENGAVSTFEFTERWREFLATYQRLERDRTIAGLRDETDAITDRTEELRRHADSVATGFGDAVGQARSLSNVLEGIDLIINRIISDIIGSGVSRGFNALFDAIFGSAAPLSSPTPLSKPSGFGALIPLVSAFAPGGRYDTGGATPGPRGTVAGVVHGQEFVVRAGPAQRFRPLLENINEGRLPGFQSGGFVGRVSNTNAALTGGTEVNVHNNSGVNARVERRREGGGREVIDVIVGEVGERLGRGDFDQSLGGRYALKPARIKR